MDLEVWGLEEKSKLSPEDAKQWSLKNVVTVSDNGVQWERKTVPSTKYYEPGLRPKKNV